MRASKRWIYEVTPRDIENMDFALAHVHRNNLKIPFDRADFPLADFAETMRKLLHEMEDGSGVVLMRDIPVEKYGLENSRLLYWGLGQHLGYALAQTPRAELLIDVKDTGGDQYKDPTVRGYHTDRRLPFHNDQGDVVGLLCIRGAKSGGLSCTPAPRRFTTKFSERGRTCSKFSTSPTTQTSAAKSRRAASPITQSHVSPCGKASCSASTAAPTSIPHSASPKCRALRRR
jgi:hypothetical protein